MAAWGSQPDAHGYDGDLESSGPSSTDWVFLILGSARRRKFMVLAVFLLGIGASLSYYLLKTPIYRVEAMIFAQRQQALPSVVRAAAPDEAPTRSAWELIHRRENLVSLVKETNLLEEKPRSSGRQLLSALKPATASNPQVDPLDMMVRRLDQTLVVTTGDGTVTIAIDWPDASQAYHLVESAVQNFLEARHLLEITAIDETISLLEGRTATLREQLAKVIEETRRGGDGGTVRPRTSRRQTGTDSVPRATSLRGPVSGELARLKSILEAKERAIQDVEGFRRRRLADLQAQLDEKRTMYAEAHPTIIALRKDIDALSQESPQIVALREEERQIRQEYAARLGEYAVHLGEEPGPSTIVLPPSTDARPFPAAESGGAENERVRQARFQYERMVERVNAAQLELDAARAAFKYRYNVIRPPQMPRAPTSPSRFKALVLGPIASLILALAAACAVDLIRGRVVGDWQIKHMLGLPILAEKKRG